MKENVAPSIPGSRAKARASTTVHRGDRAASDAPATYFYVFNAEKSPQFVLESSPADRRAPLELAEIAIGAHNHFEIASAPRGPLAVLASRYVLQEARFCERFLARGSPLNTPAAAQTLRALTADLSAQAMVVLAHPFRASGAQDGGGKRTDRRTVAILTARPGEDAGLCVAVCPAATWAAWTNALSATKLYLAVDLDRTVIDSYTLEMMRRLLMREDGEMSERAKSALVCHYLALENYRLTGEIPWFLVAIHGKENVTLEGDGAVCIDRGRGSRLVFTRYPNGSVVLFWVRPGWDRFVDRIQQRYFTCFITQSAPMHADLALKVLKVRRGGVGDGESSRDDVKVLTVCREGRGVVTKAFCLTGAKAEGCWCGLDDLCDGADLSRGNLDGVVTWIGGDLPCVLKPIPFHAYSEEPGKSDAVSLDMCVNLLEGVHERFFAAVERLVGESKGYEDLATRPLARVADIMGYYHRNNTTSSQGVASFMESVLKRI